MNVGVILIGLVVLAAAAMGFVAMMSANAEPTADTFGNTTDERTNATHSLMTNTSAPIATAGGGIVLAVAIVFVGGLLFAVLGLILYGRRSNGGYGNR